MQEKAGINIYSVQANSLYCVKDGIKFIKKDKKQGYKETEPVLVLGKSVLPESLFLDYMRNSITVSQRTGGMCYDFVQIEFDDGYGGNVYQLEEIKDNKSDSDQADDKISKYRRKILKTSLDIRTEFYQNGVEIEWHKKDKDGNKTPFKTVKYRMLGRTPGKAKQGECLFIREDLHMKALSYLTMNLYSKIPDENAPIVELSAYQMLTTANAIDYITIPWEQILVIQDEKSISTRKNGSATVTKGEYTYEEDVIDYANTELNINQKKYSFDKNLVDIKNESGENWILVKKSHKSLENNGLLDGVVWIKNTKTRYGCIVDRDTPREFENVLWDGMGLIDESIFPKNMEGFVYCRNHFFKACLLRGNIQEYFKEHYKERYETATVVDMFGNVLRIKDIKVITTNNAIKWLKFNDLNLMGNTLQEQSQYYADYLQKHGNKYAILKTGHISKWKGGLQKSSYQMINSLPCVDPEILRKIAQTSVDYLNDLKIDLDSFMHHLKITANDYNINNVLIELNKWNADFKYSEYFANKRTSIISDLKKEVQSGKIFLPGDNLTMFGNPIVLLMKAIGQNLESENCFNTNEDWIECYTNRFSAGEKLAGFRSPHNAPNNIVHLRNVQSDMIAKYFPNIGNSVIVVNCIGTDIQSRTNGCDFDSDYLFVTNQAKVVELAKKAYAEYPTIINDIPLIGTSDYDKDMKSYAVMDDKIMSAQIDIGKASNVAQLALSYYYDKGTNSKELEDVFIICSVLAQAAVDASKRVYDVKIRSEITQLQNLPCMKYGKSCKKVYPVFFANEQRNKGNEMNLNDILVREDMKCPMDIIAKIIDENVIDLRKHPKYKIRRLPNECFFEYTVSKNMKRKQRDSVISAVKEYQEIEKECCQTGSDDCAEKLTKEFNSILNKLKKMKLSTETMSALIGIVFDDTGTKKKMQREKNKITDKLLVFLYNYCKEDKTEFLRCFKKTEKECQ